MATIIEATIPVEEFALAETLQVCQDATVECEQLVESPKSTVMPLVWVHHTTADAFEAALAQDSTVESYTQLGGSATEWLYEMDWRANIQLVLQIFTMEGAVILDAVGTTDGWHLRVLFPDRNGVRTTTDFCEARDLSITIHTIREFDSETDRHGRIRDNLTPDQHEALTAAYKQGYFKVPRDDSLETIADELNVSHQALSERLRRGHHTLIKNRLVIDPIRPTDDDPAPDTARRTDEDTPPVND
jgi:predicted DNA binding protein